MNNEIISLAQGMELDENRHSLICPKCKGGVHRDKSFTITRIREGLLYYCYRVQCHNKGFVSFLDDKTFSTKRKKEFKPRFYNYETKSLTYRQIKWFEETYGVTYAELSSNVVRYCPERQSYVYPIRDSRGYTVGCEDRVYNNKRTPKSISYWFNDVPHIHYCRPLLERVSRVLLVEDMLSGIKCNRYVPTIVLLGTALKGKIKTVAQHTDHVILALDPDAHAKSIQYKREFGILFNKFEVLLLDRDPKNMADEELEEILNGE